MSATLWDYSKLLAEQLRFSGVREAEVRDIVAEVQDHVLATGEEPLEAFGTPVEYAQSWRPLSWRFLLLRVLAASVGVVGLWSVLASLLPESPVGWSDRLILDSQWMTTVASWVLAGALIPWTIGIWSSRQRARRLSRRGGRRAIGVLELGFMAVLVLGLAGAGLLGWGDDSPVPSDLSVSAPRWLVLVGGLAMVPMLRFFGWPSRELPARPGRASSGWMLRLRRLVG